MTRVALYVQVSTSDKDQDPEMQLMPLREFVAAKSWETFGEYVDHAPATDLAHRIAWSELLDDASKRKFDLLLVWRMDRAFRSVLDADDPGAAEGMGCRPPFLLGAVAGHHVSIRRSPLLHHRSLRTVGAGDPA